MSENREIFLYRYRHLNGQHREWTKRILTESVLHFANPATFNDPFDCKVHYLPTFPKEAFRQQHKDRIKRHMSHLERNERRIMLKQDLKALDPKMFSSHMTDAIQTYVDGVGVLSLSATDRNILLWSHYADGHRGLCFRFRATDETAFYFARSLPVNYVSSYPGINVTSSPEEKVDAFLLTKAIDWSYEKEYRILDHDGAGDKSFPAELLVSVILGAAMDPEDKKTVAEWVSKRKCHTDILEASLSPESFSVDIRPYKG